MALTPEQVRNLSLYGNAAGPGPYEYACAAVVGGEMTEDGFSPDRCHQPAIAVSLTEDEGRCGSHLPGGSDYGYVEPADAFVPTVLALAA